jgi:hypothetical protein
VPAQGDPASSARTTSHLKQITESCLDERDCVLTTEGQAMAKCNSNEEYKARQRAYYLKRREVILEQRRGTYAADAGARQKAAARVRRCYIQKRAKFDQLGLDSNGFRSTSRRRRRATPATARRVGGVYGASGGLRHTLRTST